MASGDDMGDASKIPLPEKDNKEGNHHDKVDKITIPAGDPMSTDGVINKRNATPGPSIVGGENLNQMQHINKRNNRPRAGRWVQSRQNRGIKRRQRNTANNVANLFIQMANTIFAPNQRGRSRGYNNRRYNNRGRNNRNYFREHQGGHNNRGNNTRGRSFQNQENNNN
ncbi:GATA zinc finger domain-containing protein 15-like [Leptopilina heterotoma]|uniref:GATA zinc finger domain-containing protein 15-like n=1 Tax=Leptopilina heterotoma TaxID=63436 RepID=UPI001CA935E9|nr:GATA zinc finger domain-containing protein 15-like [Leptopilina heterotoma]